VQSVVASSPVTVVPAAVGVIVEIVFAVPHLPLVAAVTVTDAFPLAPWDDAVIVAFPWPTAATVVVLPVWDTVATFASVVAHETGEVLSTVDTPPIV
jgi:hypothetical protein